MRKAFSYSLVSLIFIYLFWNVYQNRETLVGLSLNFTVPSILILALFSLGIHFFNVLAWHFVTKALSFKVSFKDNLRLWTLSNLSRLLPGGIWQYPTRLYLLTSFKVPKATGFFAITLEFLLSLGVGAALALFVISRFGIWLDTKYLSIALVFLLGLVLPAILVNPRVIRFVSNFSGRIKSVSKILEKWEIPPGKLIFLSGVYIPTFVFPGITLFILARGIVDLDINQAPLFIGAFAFAWLIGYVSIFAPGGLGVTEGVLTILLSSLMPFAVASLLALLFRGVLLVSEAVFATLVVLFTRSSLPQQDS